MCVGIHYDLLSVCVYISLYTYIYIYILEWTCRYTATEFVGIRKSSFKAE